MIYIKIDKLYRVISRIGEKDLETLLSEEKVKVRRLEDAKNFILWLSSQIEKTPRSLEEFKTIMIKLLQDYYRIDEVLNELYKSKLPLNPKTFLFASKRLGKEIKLKEASTLIRYIKGLEIVSLRPLPVYTPDIKDRIFEFILRKGKVRYSAIVNRFGERKSDLLDLHAEGKINIQGLEELGVPREKINKIETLNLSKLNVRSKFLRVIRDTEGTLIPQIVIPRNTVIEVVIGGEVE